MDSKITPTIQAELIRLIEKKQTTFHLLYGLYGIPVLWKGVPLLREMRNAGLIGREALSQAVVRFFVDTED